MASWFDVTEINGEQHKKTCSMPFPQWNSAFTRILPSTVIALASGKASLRKSALVGTLQIQC